MITRRNVMFGGLLSLAGAATGCGCALASEHTGCVLAGHQAARFLARESLHAPARNERLFARSADREFDYALAQTLSGLTDTFGVLPGFAYYDDRAFENAYATTARQLGKADGTVLFGRRFLNTLMSQPADSEVAVAAICAHEFGHIAQFKYNMIDKLVAGTRTVKRAELHADFLAGYYAGVRKRQKPDYPVDVFAAGLSNLKPMQTATPGHGSPGERASAIALGFQTSYRDHRSLAEAMRIGMDHVRRLPA
jgi:hypothetical protein